MRLRQIEIFSAIMHTGTTSGAAQLLHISQPAVSRTLQHAEITLGFPLFQRVKGKLIPTPEARALYREMLPFDEQLMKIRRLIAGLRAGSSSPLRVVATPTLADHLLPPAIAEWSTLYPGAKCRLAVSHSQEMIHALLLNEADIGLTMQPVSHPNLLCTAIKAGEICAIAPLGHWPDRLLATPISASAFSDQVMITIDASDYLGMLIANWLTDVIPPPKATITVQTYSLARSLVEGGVGISLVDSFTAYSGRDVQFTQIRRLEIKQPLQVYVLWTDSNPPSKTAKHLVKLLRR